MPIRPNSGEFGYTTTLPVVKQLHDSPSRDAAVAGTESGTGDSSSLLFFARCAPTISQEAQSRDDPESRQTVARLAES